jgi:hypothetical protein
MAPFIWDGVLQFIAACGRQAAESGAAAIYRRTPFISNPKERLDPLKSQLTLWRENFKLG